MRYQFNESQRINSTVWIIGDSLLMEGIFNCMDDQKFPNLICLDQWDAKLINEDETNHPKLIIFELDSPCACNLLELLQLLPGIHLLGIDGNCSRVTVLNSINRRTQTMNELFQIINEITRGGE